MNRRANAVLGKRREKGLAGFCLFDAIASARVAAKAKGYALAVHGSLSRDIDLVAIPWTDKAVSAEEVVEAIRVAVGGFIMCAEPNGREGWYSIDDESKHSPVERAHGRRAWSIYGIPGHSYIDLSVTPCGRAPAGEPPPHD